MKEDVEVHARKGARKANLGVCSSLYNVDSLHRDVVCYDRRVAGVEK